MTIEFRKNAQTCLFHIGTCRFSNFVTKNSSLKLIIQKITPVVIGVFSLLSLYDLGTGQLSFQLKLLVHGTMSIIVTSLVLSVLFKKFFPSDSSQKNGQSAKTQEKVETTSHSKSKKTIQTKKNSIKNAVLEQDKQFFEPSIKTPSDPTIFSEDCSFQQKKELSDKKVLSPTVKSVRRNLLTEFK